MNTQVFRYVEDAPLLLLLEDFIQDLDHLLVQYEGDSDSQQQGEGRKREEEMEGKKRQDTDGQYVALLEMYCLLRQRRNDVRHCWRYIYNSLFSARSLMNGVDYHYGG